MEASKILSTNSTLKNFDDATLIQAAKFFFENLTFGEGGEDYVPTPVPFFFQILKAMHKVPTLQPFIDPNLLQNLGSRLFKDASASIAHHNLMVSSYSRMNGTLTYMEERLQVKRLTMGLVATCLGLLVHISILEVFFRP